MIGGALTAILFEGAAVRETSGRSRTSANHVIAAKIRATVIDVAATTRTDHCCFSSAGGDSPSAVAATDGSIR